MRNYSLAVKARAKEMSEEDGYMWHLLSAREKNQYYSLASHELAPEKEG
jgi:hypothetical protein